MFQSRSEYDRGVNTFSPEGRLFQVEYALEAIKLGSTAVGVQTAEGVVIAVEKRIPSPLVEPRSIEKIVEVDVHAGAALSGLTADARTLIEHARREAQNHRFHYDEPMPVESIARAVCDLALRFGESGEGGDDDDGDDNDKNEGDGEDDERSGPRLSRPFGVALLIAGWDENGPALYTTDPSGTCIHWGAKAIGAGSEAAQNALQEQYRRDMRLAEAEVLALRVLRQVMEEKLNAHNVEVAAVTRTVDHARVGQFQLYSTERVKACVARLPETETATS
ncbi:hypothetical protein CDCA_CDCA10G2953 [Cyanidium caldarium]|uniref:Proteasome subunit alpha type n=1 Tax=Cyanidium caldarium TaxID=2771 RepID=A0AAV9IYP1_CYACA|nr:hypothetical protein CDCA_CDCA10G2953 [Cyanidium caldarium]